MRTRISIRGFVRPSVRPSVGLSVYLSVRLSVCLKRFRQIRRQILHGQSLDQQQFLKVPSLKESAVLAPYPSTGG